jgi:acetyltransferase-like isoleucine patch superfamily enzyme
MLLDRILNTFLKPYLTRKLSIFDLPKSSILKLVNIINSEKCILKIGEESVILGLLYFERQNATISIGKKTFIGNSKLAAAEKISIGDNVLISWGVTIVDHNSHSIIYTNRDDDITDWRNGRKDWSHVLCAPVTICDKVWIGFNVCILKGVTIGEGSIVGSGSVVTKDVPEWTIVGGNPAKVIREIPEDER